MLAFACKGPSASLGCINLLPQSGGHARFRRTRGVQKERYLTQTPPSLSRTPTRTASKLVVRLVSSGGGLLGGVSLFAGVTIGCAACRARARATMATG